MKAKDFVNEKWTEKYKKSINCQNPKGFSQKAHCAGRKKNEDAVATMPDVELPNTEPGAIKKGAKKLGKVLGKGLGALDFIDAAYKFGKGDVPGGAQSTLSGITYAVPFVGLPLGLGRDLAKDAGYDPLDYSSKAYPKGPKGETLYPITPFESKSNVLKGIVVAEQSDFSQMLKNITAQNPRGSAAEQILLGKFLGSDQGTYARNVLGKNHKGWIEHIASWLKKNQLRLEKEFNELDFSDLQSLAYDMYENYLAKQGQLEEGEVVSLEAKRSPLVVAGSPYDWDIYDLRTNKMVANILGGDRHESPLYEIRINRNGMTPTTRMKPTYVLRAGRDNNPPYYAYELVAPEGGFGKVEKSPGPGGTTKLRPDQDDILRHVFKTLGGGKYYGYDLNMVEEGLDQWELVEKALGAKIMEVDDAMELGYTDWNEDDGSGYPIIYLGNQKNEGILKEYDTKTIDAVVQRLPKGLNINNFTNTAFKEFLYQKYYQPLKAGWDKLWPFFSQEYNQKHGIKEYKRNPHQIVSGDSDFFDNMLLVIPKGLKSNELYTQAFKEFIYNKFGSKEWPDFKKNRYTYWDAYEKLGGNKPQGFFGKLKSKIGMDENLLNTYGDQLGLDETEAGLGTLINSLLEPKQESSIMKGLQAEETRKQRKPLSDKDEALIQAIWGYEQQGMLQDKDRYLVYTAKHGVEADEPNYNSAMHHVYRIYKQFPKLDYPVLVYDRKTKTPLYFDGVEDYYNKTQPLKHKTHEGYSDGAQGGSGIGVEASPIVQAYQSQVYEHINTPGGMGQSYRKYEPKVSGTSESAVIKGLRELSPNLISPDERPEEFFRNLAAQWKFGTPEDKATIEKTLKQMHYAIGDDMRYDPDGVFITGAKDYKGKSYMSWSIDELKPSQKLDEKCWDTHKQVGMKKKGGRMVPNCVPKESAVMKGIQSEKVEEYKEIEGQRKIEFSKENPPDLYYLYQQFIQRMLNPENTIDPYEWIDKVNKHYGLNYTWKDYQKRGHNDHTNNWQKIIDKYILKKGLNEFEQLDEGMLQKLAGLALGTVLALGPKIGQADTVFTYLHPETKKFITVDDMSKVPKDAIYAMAVDTDTNQVMVLKGEGAKGQTIQPDPAAVKQGQQQVKQPQAQQPQAQQPQAQQPQTQQPQAQQPQTQQPHNSAEIFANIQSGLTPDQIIQQNPNFSISKAKLTNIGSIGKISNFLGVNKTTVKAKGKLAGPYNVESGAYITFNNNKSDGVALEIPIRNLPKEWQDSGILGYNKGQAENLVKEIVKNAPQNLGSRVGKIKIRDTEGREIGGINIGYGTAAPTKSGVVGVGTSFNLFGSHIKEFVVTQDYENGRIVIPFSVTDEKYYQPIGSHLFGDVYMYIKDTNAPKDDFEVQFENLIKLK